MNLISFSLFGKEDRYWHSLPSCLSAHMVAYPDYQMRLYVSKDAVDHEGYSFLTTLSSLTDKFNIVCVNDGYKGTEPTIWRMKPMWENDVDIFFCRDIDSAPTSEEKTATEVFIKSNFAIHGIRSYELHNIDLMAGLCGFKPKIMRKLLFCKSFEDYRAFGVKNVPYCKEWKWGCDQQLLRKFLFSGVRGRYCTKLALDSMIGSARKVKWYRGNQLPATSYENVDISSYSELFNITDSMFRFLAEPFHFNKEQSENILSVSSECNDFIKRSLVNNTFYAKLGYKYG